MRDEAKAKRAEEAVSITHPSSEVALRENDHHRSIHSTFNPKPTRSLASSNDYEPKTVLLFIPTSSQQSSKTSGSSRDAVGDGKNRAPPRRREKHDWTLDIGPLVFLDAFFKLCWLLSFCMNVFYCRST